MNKLKFYKRRQFFLGPEPCELEGWQRIRINHKYILSYHPDLLVNSIKTNNIHIILLGFLLDPLRPSLSDQDLLREMAMFRSLNELLAFLFDKSGRFVLIINLDQNIYILNDPGSLRQVEYTFDKDRILWCASHYDLIAEKVNCGINKEAFNFIYRMSRDRRVEYWLMNDSTLFKEIKHLLPNHYLDEKEGRMIRFWPKENKIEEYDVEEAINLANKMLIGSIEAIANRFNIKMGISAGVDSRLMLAASKNTKEKITYFSIDRGPNIKHMDVMIPCKLRDRLKLNYEIVNFEKMDPLFLSLYQSSVPYARASKGDIAYSIYKKFGPENIVLTGNASEITQCNYWLPGWKLDGEGLAVATGLYHPFAEQEFNKWLMNARDICKKSGINILTLFHWEQRVGRWAAMSYAEYDIAHESFTPFVNRKYIQYLLGIRERHRKGRMLFVPKKQIALLWKETLLEPINPGNSVLEKFIGVIRRRVLDRTITPLFPIYQVIIFMKRYIKNRLSKDRKKISYRKKK